jgi:hypothetical protein
MYIVHVVSLNIILFFVILLRLINTTSNHSIWVVEDVIDRLNLAKEKLNPSANWR